MLGAAVTSKFCARGGSDGAASGNSAMLSGALGLERVISTIDSPDTDAKVILCRTIGERFGSSIEQLEDSVTVHTDIARKAGARREKEVIYVTGFGKMSLWSLPGPVGKASSVVLRIVNEKGRVVSLPHKSCAREQIAHAVKCDVPLCIGARLRKPAGIAHDAVVVRIIPWRPFLLCGSVTSVTFDEATQEGGEEKDHELALELDQESIPHTAKNTVMELASEGPGPQELSSVQKLRELVLWPILYASNFQRFDRIGSPRGILLYGPPGTGKTRAARSVYREISELTNCEFYSFGLLPDGASESGDVQERLRETFAKAHEFVQRSDEKARAIIFIDEIDGLCPKRQDSGPGGGGGAAAESRIVAQLLTLMDGLYGQDDRVIVLAATNRQDSMDPALRRPGRFEVELRFDPPNASERSQILATCIASQLDCSKHSILESLGDKLGEFAQSCVGYVAADLEAVAMSACVLTSEPPTVDELYRAKESIGSAASLRKHKRMNHPDVLRSRKGVGGYLAVKLELAKVLEWPVKHAATMARLQLQPPRGILLHGPPGCSKTTLAREVAAKSGYSFFTLSGADVYSPFVGDAERAVRELFINARQAVPAVIFLDEIDALVGKRSLEGGGLDVGSDGVQSRVLSTLLNEMDGVQTSNGLLVLAATNRKDMIDAALLRPGRFDRHVEVGLPTFEDRLSILEIHTTGMPFRDREQLIAFLARGTEGLSGAELANLCREAAMHAMRSGNEDITVDDFPSKLLQSMPLF